MTAAQQRAIRKREVAKRLDRIGQSLMGVYSELCRIECPSCAQRDLVLDARPTSVVVTCQAPTPSLGEDGDGVCDYRHVVYSVSDDALPRIEVEQAKLVAPKRRRRRVI